MNHNIIMRSMQSVCNVYAQYNKTKKRGSIEIDQSLAVTTFQSMHTDCNEHFTILIISFNIRLQLGWASDFAYHSLLQSAYFFSTFQFMNMKGPLAFLDLIEAHNLSRFNQRWLLKWKFMIANPNRSGAAYFFSSALSSTKRRTH